MYLDTLIVENFRLFGSISSGKALTARLQPGINLIVGPNDAGKTCLIDAVRLLVGTVTGEFFRVGEDDFHISEKVRADRFSIVGEFRGLSSDDAAAFYECLGTEVVEGSSQYVLRIKLSAVLLDSKSASPRRRRVRVEWRAGTDDDGVRIDSAAREFLAATYLKPLRDAVYELAARRGSRLSQILQAYRHIDGHETSDWSPGCGHEPQTLLGIAQRADHAFRNTNVIREAEKDLNENHLSAFSIGTSPLTGRIEPSGQELRHVLERLELSLSDSDANNCRGLGIHNLLFIATELLALAPSEDADLPLLLIEEPEAHLHPQYQQRLIEYMLTRSKEGKDKSQRCLQILLTSHSPHFASQVPLDNITLLHAGRAFPLSRKNTRLNESDYAFLQRFLDVTKANLFFARGVIIVEGDAEALLLPAIARRINRPLDRAGVSIVNVGHTGLFRYSKIFQRNNDDRIPVRVACITDRDIPPPEAAHLITPGRETDDKFTADRLSSHVNELRSNDGQNVKTFVSPTWTLEFDLVLSGMGRLVHQAISLARASKAARSFPAGERFDNVIAKADEQFDGWEAAEDSLMAIAVKVYEPLVKRQASKAEAAQALTMLLDRDNDVDLRPQLPCYLAEAIDYATGGV